MTPQPTLGLPSPPPPRLNFRAEDHKYFVESGPLGDPTIEELPSVTRCLEDAGIIDWSMVPPAVLERARDRGTAVHQALHYFDDGELDQDSLDPALHPYVMAYAQFKNQAQFEPLLVEHMVWSPVYRYAGRMDRVGIMGPALGSAKELPPGDWLIDFKSGVVLPGHKIQLAAYAMLLPEPRKYRRAALQLKPDGSYKLYEYPQRDLQPDFQVFQSACALWHWKANNR